MKKFFYLFVLMFLSQQILAQNPFITRWDLSKPGSGSNNRLAMSTATSGIVGYTWTTVPAGTSGMGTFNGGFLIIADLPANAIIDLSIAPSNFQQIRMASGTDRQRLMEIKQWGDVAWTSMEGAFSGCSNMTLTAADVPNLTGVTNMSSMFSGCSSFNQALPDGFNTLSVTDMNNMFASCTSFNQALPESFNTSSVTNMSAMFSNCTSFNQALPESFNTSLVTNMSGMFFGCSIYNKPLPNNFITSSVTNMNAMFRGSRAFNQSLSTFNTSLVTNMSYMFFDAIVFNQSLEAWGTKLNANVNLVYFLDYSGMNVANYDATLRGFNASGVTGRDMGAAGLKYCDSEGNRASLTSAKSWRISSDLSAVPAPPTVGTRTQPTCTTSTGSVVLSGLPASGTWTLTRNPGSVTSTGNGTTTTVTGLTEGTYTFTVTNSSGCTSLASANVVINAAPLPPDATLTTVENSGTVINDGTICAGASVTLSVPDGGTGTTYSWSNGETTNSITVSPIATTTYSVTVTRDGCSLTNNRTITVNELPSVSIQITENSGVAANDGIICQNDPVTLKASDGGILYQWNDASTAQSITVNPSVTSTYSVNYQDSRWCVATASVEINVVAPTTYYADLDNDGYSSGTTLTQCERPAGYKLVTELSATSGDCNDNNADIKPGATEICDGIDNNCDGIIDGGTVCPADYTISTTGGVLTITDVSGNGETLNISENGANIRFATVPATRTYSLNGGATTAFSTPADVALLGVSSIVVNTEVGDDIISIGEFNITNLLPSLTINGGAGDDHVNFNGDITFAADANLDVVDLQDDTATPSTNAVDFSSGANLILSGTGTATLKVSKGVRLGNNASLETSNGNLIIEVNQATAVVGGFYCVLVDGATLRVNGTGVLSIKGKSENLPSVPVPVYGVYVRNGGVISGGISGTATIEGVGFSMIGSGAGVNVTGTNSRITSLGSHVVVIGTSNNTGSGALNRGVIVTTGGTITAGGSGNVSVTGTGGSVSNGNAGVYVAGNTSTMITSSGGNVSVTGTGGGTGNSIANYGIWQESGGTITAGGSGSVTVQGTGGTTTGNDNYGIYLNGANTQITSGGGNVIVTGQGGGSGSSASNFGVLLSLAKITAGGTGTVTVNGTGGNTMGGDNYGVYVSSSTAQINSSGGAISVTGQGGGGTSAGGRNYGIYSSGIISAGGTGSVTVNGTGANTSGISNHGIYFTGGSINSTNGNINITAQGGGSGTSSNNRGMSIHGGAQVLAGGSGNVVIQANGSIGTAAGANHGLNIEGAGSLISSTGGNVTINAVGGGTAASDANFGIYMRFESQIRAGGSGTVSITGQGGSGTGLSNHGVNIGNAGTQITSGGGNIIITGIEGGSSGVGIDHQSPATITTATSGGNITLIANSMNLAGTVSTQVPGGSTTLRPYTNNVAINLGTATNTTGGPLGLSDTELDQITTGTLVIGHANSGIIDVSAAITRPASTNVQLVSSGDVLISGGGFDTGGGTMSLSSVAVKPTFNDTDVTASRLSFASNLSIVINGTTLGNGTVSTYTQLKITGEVNLAGVNLLLTGTYVPVGGNTFTIVDNDGSDAILGTFTDLLEGATIPNFRGSGLTATISYTGGTDNNDVVITVNAPIVVSINNPTVVESSTGTVTMSFNVTMNTASDADVSLNYATVDNTATTADGDYQSNSGTLTFTAGQTSKQVDVTINGDCKTESAETLLLRLSNLITNGRNVRFSNSGTTLDGTGTIQNAANPITFTAPTVTPPSCSTAGTIVVNANASSSLEYSIDDGSSWQGSATFNNLSAANYQLKARLQASSSCEATYGSNPVVLTSPFTASTTTDTWTGCVSTDWATAGNWQDGTVPTVNDDVMIPNTSNKPEIMAGTLAVAKSVEVLSSARLTLNASGNLTINGSKIESGPLTSALIVRGGTVVNNGLLVLGNSSSVGSVGVSNYGTFTNAGELRIDRFTAAGINNVVVNTFTNSGKIIIGANATGGATGLVSAGTFTNLAGGEINISQTSQTALNSAGDFTNSGKIILSDVGNRGLDFTPSIAATFSNNGSGEITINGVVQYAINVGGGTFTNTAKITIGGTGSAGSTGILNSGTFNNNQGGELSIDRTSFNGIFNYATFVNAGKVSIGTNTGGTLVGIRSQGTFTNRACATLIMTSPINNTGTNSFTNSGYFRVSTASAHTNSISGLVNNGVIEYPVGNAIPNVVNNGIIAVPISGCSPALQIGASNTLAIGTTWYQEAALTTSAGTYQLASNSFSSTRSFPGTYDNYFSVSDATNSCSYVASVSQTLDALPTITTGPSPAICAGSNSFTIPYTATTGSPTTYSISGVGITAENNAPLPTTPIVVNLSDPASGNLINYTLTVSNAGGCTSNIITGSVTVNAAPTANIIYGGSPFCKSVTSAVVTLTGSGGGTFSSTSGLSIDGTTGAINPSTSTAGTYTVTYTIAAASGCSEVIATTSVTITTSPSATINYGGTPYCKSVTSAAVTLTGSSGGMFSSTSGLTLDGTTGAINPSTSTAGTYTVTYSVVASGGCSVVSTTASVVITDVPSATINYGGTPYCKSVTSAAVTLTGNSGGTFSSTSGLSIDGTTGAINPSTSTAGTYTVTYSLASSGGCAAVSATANVTITDTPSATINYGGTPYCKSVTSAAVILTGSSGGTFSSTSGLTLDGTTGAINPSTSTAGTYTVTYSIAASGGCSAVSTTASVVITDVPSATINYGGTPYCKSVTSAAVTLTGSSGGMFSSTSGLSLDGTTGAINPSTSTAGTYTVTYSIAASGGCAGVNATASVVITDVPSATINYGGTPYCKSVTSAAVTLTGSSGGMFSSTSGLTLDGTTGAINPSTSTAGTYTVTYSVVASGGCSAVSTTANVTITDTPSATINYSGSPFCKSLTSGVVTLTGSSGGTFSSTSGLSIDGTTGAINPSTSTAGTYTVTYTIAASGGCSEVIATTSVTITTSPSATINYANTPYCKSVTSAAVTLTGNSGGTFSSTSGLSLDGTTGAINPSTSTAGTYTVTYSLGASGGCAAVSATANVTITDTPSATINYANTPYCKSVTSAAVTLTGNGGGTFSSTSGLSLDGTTGAINPSTSTAGTYTVTYSIAASGGCSAVSATASVVITDVPSATINYGGTPYCKSVTSAAVTLTGSSGGTFSSTSGLSIDGTTGAINPSTSTAGTYTVTYTIAAAGGCSEVIATTSVTITTSPSATINYANTPYCKSVTSAAVTLTGNSGGTFSSTSGLTLDGTTGAINLSTSTAGTYTVTYSLGASGGCSAVSATASVTITDTPSATINYSGSPFCKSLTSGAVTLTGSSGGTFSSTSGLSIDGTTGAINPSTSTAGTYTVTYSIAASGGCSAVSATANVTITDTPSATINYSGSPFCKSLTSGVVTLTGSSGGTFSSTSGLSIDGTTGAINPSTSTAGTYTVTYSLASSGGCAAVSATGNVTITDTPSATINYSGSPFCKSLTSGVVTLTGSSGGTFSSTSGLSIDGTTGAINPSTSTAGTYTVTYTIAASGGCSEVIATTSVTITTSPSATINYANTPYCKSVTSAAVTLTGNSGGTFSSTSGLSIDGTTGAINPSTSTAGTYTVTYSLAASGGCSAVSATANVTITDTPSATINYSGSPFCKSLTSGAVTLTGNSGGTFSSTSGLSLDGTTGAINPSTSTAGTYTVTYSIASSGGCAGVNATTVVAIQGKPTITLNTLQQMLVEGNNPVLCDTDANPVNSLQFTVSGLCVVGSPVWRVQVGNGAWSAWSATAPVSQPSNNQPHRYQAACDANCTSTYSGVIELTINNRATVPQNVSLVVDGVTVAVGETKEVCSLVTIPLTFNANCAAGEIVLYSVDGGEYSSGVPTGLVDNQYHNYRVRCRKSDGTPSCVESESGVMRLKLVTIPTAPTVSLSSTSSCDATASFSGQSTCSSLRTVWYNATTNVALPNLPSTVPSATTSYYARCQTENGCVSEKSNVVTFTLTPTQVAPVITASQEIVCTGTTVTISANCPAGSQTFWNTGVTAPSFQVAFNNVTKQTYWAKCLFEGGCQSSESVRKDIYWNAFVVTLINVGETKSSVKPANDKSLWSSQFITRDGGPELEQSTQVNPTLFYVENANKIAPRYWTINVEACGLSTDGSLTFDMLATPEMGVIRSFNTHENNAPYFMYANREGWTELYAQNHPAYGFYQDNGAGGNVYDAGLPKGLYKLSIRYWDMKGWGSIYPSTRQPQGNVLAYQEYWFRIQSKDGVGVGAARTAESGGEEKGVLVPPLGRSAARARGLAILPNPVTNILRLQVQDSKGQSVQTELLDASGRQVLRRTFSPETNAHYEEMNVEMLPEGLYLLRVITNDKQEILKVIKK